MKFLYVFETFHDLDVVVDSKKGRIKLIFALEFAKGS